MPSPPRINETGFVHHVIARGNNKQNLFKDPSDFLKFSHFLSEAITRYPLAIYNYALMTNHFHLLVETKQEGSLSKVLEETTREYAKYFNKKYDHIGHVFQGRFKSIVIEEEKYFFLCSRYIDLNPIKACIVNQPEEYAWSGYKTLAFGRSSVIPLEYHALYQGLGDTSEERQISYRSIVSQPFVPNLDLENKKAGVLGDRQFKEFIKSKLNMKQGASFQAER